MLSQAKVNEFLSKGFLLGDRVLDDAQVDVLRAELDRVIAERDNRSKPQPVLARNLSGSPDKMIWQIVNIWEASEPYRELIYHPQVVEEIAQLTGGPDELRVWHDQIQYKPAETGGVNMWHQDSPYWPILQPKTSQVTAWIALDDVDESNGCMSMVPGSYHWGNQISFLHTIKRFEEMPAEFNGRKIQTQLCPVRKGCVHYHHSLTWHGSHANTSGKPRRAIAAHYMTSETRYDASGNHVMKPFVTVADGERLAGDHFPLVWRKGEPMQP
jgi:ectoine hydroxylase-related dioxygenase (phytanoyl-CoA dioxygenase family)